MGLAFGAASVLAALALAVLGADQKGIDVALQATARLSFLFFWPAYAGAALAALFGRVFQPVKRCGRELGLAFASALCVHLGLVAWRCHIGATPATSTFIVFGAAVVATYGLALLSIKPLQQAVGHRGWWLLRTVGLNYIAYAFAIDFLNNPLHGDVAHTVAYLPFATLAIVGPVLRLVALALQTGHAWSHSRYRTS